MGELYIGMISGTSVDGVDAVLAEIDAATCTIRRASTTPYPESLRTRIQRLIEAPETSLVELGRLDHAVGEFFAECATTLLAAAGIAAADVTAVGHHGQTVYHEPTGAEPFSMQIGDPNIVAARTGIATVADFRRLDMALGGQGAPLVPAFHASRFGTAEEARAVVNIGGIANVTLLAPDRAVTGFDTGPGNTLLDAWMRQHRGEAYDRDGLWSASGRVDEVLLESMLTEPYFAAAPPKSTGRELFHAAWLERHLAVSRPSDADVQATLAELTARSIAAGIRQALPECARVLVCGGGAHNADLLARLRRRSATTVESTDAYGVAPDWVEATAFAWLAHARLVRVAGSVPTVTGARRPAVLGGVYWAAAP